MRCLLLLLSVVLMGATARGQSVLGTWQGILFHRDCMGGSQQMSVRLHLEDRNGQVTGVIGYYPSFAGQAGQQHRPLFSFAIRGQQEGRSIMLRYMAMDELQGNRFAIGYYVLGSYTLALEHVRSDVMEQLVGTYRGSNGGRGELKLKRQPAADAPEESDQSVFSRLRQQQQQRKAIQQRPGSQPPAAAAPPVPVWQTNDSLARLYNAEQQTEQLRLGRTDSLHAVVAIPDTAEYTELQLYDNAEIDGDTISIYVDDVLVRHRVPLGAAPLQYRLYKPAEGRTVQVRIVAENLGSIPPNTALLQVATPAGVRRLLMRSDQRTNGLIQFNWTQ
ncbi:MAG: hypothetical protein MUF62_06530 [Chitinophagaceae bacterium]|nr:hypothetical protein [Chitinophagaceae bacterium]